MSGELRSFIKAAMGADQLTPEQKDTLGRLLFTYGWRLSSLAFGLWACGVFSEWHLGGGFAFATEVRQQASAIQSIELRLLEQDIMATYKESCASPSKDFFRSRLNQLQREYYAKNNSLLPLPTCTDLGIKQNEP